MMGSVERTRSEVHEERLVRSQGMLRLHPADRLIGHVDGEVIIGHVRRFNPDGAVEDRGRPLVRLAADEAVELVEPGVCGPTVKGSGDGNFPRWRLVVRPEGRCAVTVQAQHLCYPAAVLRADA